VSRAAIEAVKYANRHSGFSHDDLPDLMEHLAMLSNLNPTARIGAGLITEVSMSLRTVIESSNPDLNGKIRVLNGRSDMFSLILDPTTNTLEIYDLKPEADFDTDNPGSHFINHFMQLIAYALAVQAELGDEVNIRCVVFNRKGFVQFDPHKMFFVLLDFLTNLKGSKWNTFVEDFIYQVPGDKGRDYRKGYTYYKEIKPTVKYMKVFIDLWPHVNKHAIENIYSPYNYWWYLARIMKEDPVDKGVLQIFREEIQDSYLNPTS
jgi:hypothetical protein